MRIAIIGQQAFGKSVLEAFIARGTEVAGVFCAPEKPGTKPDPLRVAAEERSLPLFQLPSLKGEQAAEALRGLKVDLGVMAYVLQFAPQGFVNLPKHGTIQYHPSLLPRYRGPSSINWPIIKGDRETGLSIFRPTDGLDEGPMILQKTVKHRSRGHARERLLQSPLSARCRSAPRVRRSGGRGTPSGDPAARGARDLRGLVPRSGSRDQLARARRSDLRPDPRLQSVPRCLDDRARAQGASLRRRPAPHARHRRVPGKPGEICDLTDSGIELALQGGWLEVRDGRIDGGAKVPAAQLAATLNLAVGTPLRSEAA